LRLVVEGLRNEKKLHGKQSSLAIFLVFLSLSLYKLELSSPILLSAYEHKTNIGVPSVLPLKNNNETAAGNSNAAATQSYSATKAADSHLCGVP
jgi:hypothetical protein